MTERTHVVLATSTQRDYQFLAPLTALFWREVVGFIPRVTLVGPAADALLSPRARVVREALDGLDIYTMSFGASEALPDATVAQNIRQLLCGAGREDDWQLPADVDLWPLQRDFYQAHLGSSYRCVSYYNNGDHFQGKSNVLGRVAEGKRFQTLPTCHIAMRARDWALLYPAGDHPVRDVESTVRDWMATRAEGNDSGFDRWMSDQDIMTARLCAQEWFPKGAPQADSGRHANGAVLFVPRRGHPPADRLDRSILRPWDHLARLAGVEQREFVAQYTDAHLHRDPTSGRNWHYLLCLIDALLPQHSEWARRYHADYVEADER